MYLFQTDSTKPEPSNSGEPEPLVEEEGEEEIQLHRIIRQLEENIMLTDRILELNSQPFTPEIEREIRYVLALMAAAASAWKVYLAIIYRFRYLNIALYFCFLSGQQL